MAKKATNGANDPTKNRRAHENQVELQTPQAAPPQQPAPRANTLLKVGTNAIKLSKVSKPLREKITARQTAANNAIIEKFKDVLLDPTSTKADLQAAISPTNNSTITANIKYSEDGTGTIKRNSLPKPLKDAYNEAEAQMREILERVFEERFNAQAEHTADELMELDEMAKQIQHPFKGKFREQQAQAA